MKRQLGTLIVVTSGVTFEACSTFLFSYYLRAIQADFMLNAGRIC